MTTHITVDSDKFWLVSLLVSRRLVDFPMGTDAGRTSIPQDCATRLERVGKAVEHPIYRVVACEVVGPYILRVVFDDDTSQVINFKDILEGQLYGPLRDITLFNQVRIDPEVHTLVWPNGADFDPDALHDWPKYVEDLKKLAKRWALAETPEYTDR